MNVLKKNIKHTVVAFEIDECSKLTHELDTTFSTLQEAEDYMYEEWNAKLTELQQYAKDYSADVAYSAEEETCTCYVTYTEFEKSYTYGWIISSVEFNPAKQFCKDLKALAETLIGKNKE